MKNRTNIIFYTYLFIWFIVNLLFLTNFPFVHSDEPWLSGLSRSIIETGSFGTTEDFFDLYERNPHAIKILFHFIQIIFIKIFGYSVFSVRLISLLAGVFSLLTFNKLLRKLNSSNKIAFIATIWLSIDIQFIYITHLARQEIILIFLLILMLNILISENIKPTKRGLYLGLILGLSVGFHPNSFIIAWPIGLYLLLEIVKKRRGINEGIAFILSTITIASIFITLSFYFNGNFIHDYMAYGEPLGVLDNTDIKILKLPGFYNKLFNQISGTYYTPNIKIQMVLLPFLLIVAFIRKKHEITKIVLLGILGINLGLLIVGKYSQPSISFILPFYYILAINIIEPFNLKRNILMISFPILITLIVTINGIKSEKESYKKYLVNIENIIPEESKVLGNIIQEYAFSNGNFYDWRNLQFLADNNITLGQYISKREVEYIIVSEELLYIYKNRPYWNVLYGNISGWYPELIEYTQRYCTLVNEFQSPGYGIRITALRYKKPWEVQIFKVNNRL